MGGTTDSLPSLTVLANSRHYAHFFKQEVSFDGRLGRV
jgi:hypothetical protein